ncbi:MAG: hypothetical protein IPL39_06780 [Opitutaceae bacterium]|nr:hypothetical protein [Opitutaceae bacterium]
MQYFWRGYWPGRNHTRITAFLHRAGRGIRRHLMYHETWDDLGARYAHLHRLRQCAVALIIARFHHRLRPHATATNTWRYVRQLRWIGVRAAYAPIPSSFAVAPRESTADAAVWRQIQAAGLGEVARDQAWVAVLFGRVQPDWPAQDALLWLRRAWQASGRPHGVIVSLGLAAYGDRGWAQVVEAAGPGRLAHGQTRPAIRGIGLAGTGAGRSRRGDHRCPPAGQKQQFRGHDRPRRWFVVTVRGGPPTCRKEPW